MNFEKISKLFGEFNTPINAESIDRDGLSNEEVLKQLSEKNVNKVKMMQSMLKENYGFFSESVNHNIENCINDILNYDYNSKIDASPNDFIRDWGTLNNKLSLAMKKASNEYIDNLINQVETGTISKDNAKRMIDNCKFEDAVRSKFYIDIENVQVKIQDAEFLTDALEIMQRFMSINSEVKITDDLVQQIDKLSNLESKQQFLLPSLFDSLREHFDSDLYDKFEGVASEYWNCVSILFLRSNDMVKNPTEEVKKKYEQAIADYKKIREEYSKMLPEIIEEYCKGVMKEYESGSLSYEDALGLIDRKGFPYEIESKYVELLMSKQMEQHSSENENDVEQNIGTEQQSIEGNEGSLKQEEVPQELSLDERLRQIKVDTRGQYGKEVTETIAQFNLETEQKRIEQLQQLKEKNGKLSMTEALELRTLVTRQELRRQKEVEQTKLSMGRDYILTGVTKRLEKLQGKLNIQRQKTNAMRRGIFKNIARKKTRKLEEKVAKLRRLQGKLVDKQVNKAMLAQSISNKILTARAVGRNIKDRFSSVKESTMEDLQSQELPIVLSGLPTPIIVPTDVLVAGPMIR